MNGGEETIRTLREALRLSPDNVPLRKHLADTLLGFSRFPEAESEYRKALALAPEDAELRIALATAYHRQGKQSQALVVLEDLLEREDAPARGRVLHARLLLDAGEVERAAREYRRAIADDPASADPELAGRLGVRAPAEEPEEDAAAEVVDGKMRASAEAPAGASGIDLERPAIAFKDVGGMEKLKDEIRMKIIHPLTHPEIYKVYGKSIGGGILMYGPPGCGKTYLARATAGEVKAAFLSVGIADVLEMWIGQSERNLHELFEQARSNRPCVLFFDEVDALGASRSDMRQSAGRQLINQFLSELDGVNTSNEGILILAATNAPWHLDPAFRRPGRFDRILFVPPPDAAARAAILRILIRGKPAGDVDCDQVARKAENFSGADLKAIVDLAVEEKLREAMRQGAPAPLTTKDLLAPLKSLKPTTKEWFSTARNYALYSNQGGIYDDILDYLKLR